MIVFTFTNKENGIVFEEYPTMRELLIYGMSKFTNETFKDIIETHEKDGYKITNIEIEDKEDGYRITYGEVNTKNTRLNIPPYEFDDFLREFKELWCNKDYITDFCSFRKGELYKVLDKNKDSILLSDDNGQEIRFTYEEADKYLFG